MDVKKYLVLFIMFLFLLPLPSVSVAVQDEPAKDLKKQNPRVMVVIYSREIREMTTRSRWFGDTQDEIVELQGNRNAENQIERGLIEKGFQLVDAGQIRRKKELEKVLLKGDQPSAGKIAKDFGADILVQGEVTRRSVDERKVLGRSIRYFSNEIRIKALETDTGKILFSGYKTRPPSGAEVLLPLENATSELTEEMMASILEQWTKRYPQAWSYQLNISDATYSTLSVFKDGLLKIRGLSDVQIRNFLSRHAVLEVKYQGSLEALAKEVGQMKDPPIEIMALQYTTIEVKFRTNEKEDDKKDNLNSPQSPAK